MTPQKLCRCCSDKTGNKEINTEYFWKGHSEIYSQMLVDTFNLKLVTQPESYICCGCIKKLRDAAAFKKLVHNSEDRLQLALPEHCNGVETVPKLELDDLGDAHDFNHAICDDFDDKLSDNLNEDDIVWDNNTIKEENGGQIFVIKLEPKIDETPLKPSRSKDAIAKISKLSQMEKSILKTMVAKNKAVSGKPKDSLPLRKNHIISTNTPKSCEASNQPKTDLDDLKTNSLHLIRNSNICLFKSLKTKYKCYCCREIYKNISELREHWSVHRNERDINKIALRHRGMSFKNADISNLECRVCNVNVADLTDLQNHLATHKISFANTNHFFVPYKLLAGFVCVLCGDRFNSFYRLSVHMNSHFANNVCEICGVSFINRMSLRTHVHSIHREKHCTICKATFFNSYAKIKHMRKTHNTCLSKRYCSECDKTFQYTYLLEEHKIKAHGAARPISNCELCGKTFQTPSNLRVHMRYVHIKERNHPCGVCGTSFFTSCDRKRHEMTHEDVRSFSCEYCEGKFKTKDSMRRHLKRQHCQLYAQK